MVTVPVSIWTLNSEELIEAHLERGMYNAPAIWRPALRAATRCVTHNMKRNGIPRGIPFLHS